MADLGTVEITASRLPSSVVTAKATPKAKFAGIVNAEDFYLSEVTLITAMGEVSLKSLMVEISYYEDIFKGTISGQILISDSVSLIDRMGMNGSEYLKLKFSKTKNASAESTVSRFFRVYRVSERILKNSETETYTLNFCSEELLLSEQMKLSKSYIGQTISDIVYDILSRQLGIDDKYLYIGPTTGLQDRIIPYMKPFEAVHWLSNYAQNAQYKGADYLFYENSFGFNFASLQELFMRDTYNEYIYGQRNAGSVYDSAEITRNLTNIKSFTFLDTFDVLYGTSTGAFANRLITIDPLTMSYKDTKFDYIKDAYGKYVTLNKFPVIGDTKNRFGKKPNENADAVLKVMISNPSQKKAKGIIDKPWTVTEDIQAETFVPNRTAQLALSHYSRIRVVLPGDPNLTVGRVIKLNLPSNGKNADGSNFNEGEKDVYNSGNYLITAVRHIINAERAYDTVLEVVKDSYNAKLATYSSEPTKAIKGSHE